MRIRPALPADLDAVTACVNAAFSPYIPRIGKRPAPMMHDYRALIRDGCVWIADRGGEVEGVLVQYESDIGFYLDTVAVIPSRHGTGTGRALLQFAEEEAVRRGFDAIHLCTNSKMTENQVLYPRIGYVEYDRRTEAGYDRVFYRKPLPRLEPLRPDHVKELVRMWRESFEHGVGIVDPHPLEEQERFLLTCVVPHHAVRVAFLEAHMVGFVAANAESVSQLYVRKGFLRQRIGTRLLEWAKRQSGGSLWLHTFQRNTVAQAFYERHGFKAVARGHEPSWDLPDVRYEWVARNPYPVPALEQGS